MAEQTSLLSVCKEDDVKFQKVVKTDINTTVRLQHER